MKTHKLFLLGLASLCCLTNVSYPVQGGGQYITGCNILADVSSDNPLVVTLPSGERREFLSTLERNKFCRGLCCVVNACPKCETACVIFCIKEQVIFLCADCIDESLAFYRSRYNYYKISQARSSAMSCVQGCHWATRDAGRRNLDYYNASGLRRVMNDKSMLMLALAVMFFRRNAYILYLHSSIKTMRRCCPSNGFKVNLLKVLQQGVERDETLKCDICIGLYEECKYIPNNAKFEFMRDEFNVLCLNVSLNLCWDLCSVVHEMGGSDWSRPYSEDDLRRFISTLTRVKKQQILGLDSDQDPEPYLLYD